MADTVSTASSMSKLTKTNEVVPPQQSQSTTGRQQIERPSKALKKKTSTHYGDKSGRKSSMKHVSKSNEAILRAGVSEDPKIPSVPNEDQGLQRNAGEVEVGEVDEVSNADTTQDVPPMESEGGSVFDENIEVHVEFLNDVTDVVLGMGVFSPSAIEAAIDAVLATNVYGDVDKERAQALVEQLFS